MKTKRSLFTLGSFFSLGLLLTCAVETQESTNSPRKRLLKHGAPKPFKLSPIGDRQSSQRSTLSSSPQRSTHGRSPPAAPLTPETRALPDVSVSCSTSDFMLRVKPAFFGLGADADELKLGSSCRSTGVLEPYGDLLFTYPLSACDSRRQSLSGFLVYKFVLHYSPSPKRFPSRAHRIDVDVECRYDRNHHVQKLTVQPTWKTSVVHKKLKGRPADFQIQLMDDSWIGPAKSHVYHLGMTIYFQVSAPHLLTGGKLYIRRCYATGSKPSLRYTIIDNFGCMLDSKRDPGASEFISRTDNTLRFSLKNFQFTSDPDKEVNIHCVLFVTSEDPDPAHKSCTYKDNRWTALTGDDSICECCDSQCVTSKPRRDMTEGSAVSGPLLVSDQPHAAEDGFLPISPTSASWSREGEATIIHYAEDLHSHGGPWGSADVFISDNDDEGDQEHGEKSSVLLDMTRQPDSEMYEFGARDSNQLQDGGSGHLANEDLLKGEEGERYGGREGGLLEQMLTLVPGGKEENVELTGSDDEDHEMMASELERTNEDLVEDTETHWYFTWR